MNFIQPAGKRSRWSAYVKAGAAAVAVVSTVAWIVSACSSGTIDVCDPAEWPGGVKSSGFLEDCCNLDGFDSGIPTQPGCPNYDGSDAVNDTSDGGDAMADGPIGPPCSGQCVAFPPAAWDGPMLVWIGTSADAPPCPDTAPMDRFDGQGDLDAGPLACAQCACDPPMGSCGLPPTLTGNAANCDVTNEGLTPTPFDPPSGWDGGCTSNDTLGPGVASITIAALTIADAGCLPSQPAPPDDPPTWGTFARVCEGSAVGACADFDLCVPPPAPGFRTCVVQAGVEDCSEPWFAPYTEPHVFYQGFEDSRGCSPCTCGAPDGGTCSAEVTIYTDGVCMSPMYYAAPIDAAEPYCIDVNAALAFGSKSASPPVYVPGNCQPAGGVPGGTATPTSPTTFCCIPQP
jgi:hypothetical protein